MRLRTMLLTVFWVLFASAGYGQRRAPIKSPDFGEDGRVTFRVEAPQAGKVELRGQWLDGNVAMEHKPSGVWEATIDKIPAGIWEYSLRVDGLSIIDPNNSEIKPMRAPRASILHIPGEPPLVHDFQNVPHGTVHLHTYDSPVSASPRRLAVYTPPGYEHALNQQYPLLVLQHGSGDNEATWVTHGKAHWIADNLIAQHKAKPMVIIMLDGHLASTAERGQGSELFEKDLIEHVIPFVESTYRVIPSANQRAIVGLSMGGGQSLTVGLKNTDKFAWVGGFSAAIPNVQTIAAGLDNAEQTNQRLKLLWIGCGKDDFLVQRNEEFIQLLKSKGVEHEWHLTAGNHSWPVWRTYLATFLPRIF